MAANKADKVEGTKDFNDAYDKLVQKFYNDEGANLLIPADDMVLHEYNQHYKAKIDIHERQRKIDEMREKKEAKIRMA